MCHCAMGRRNSAHGQTGLDFDGGRDTTLIKQIPFDDAMALLRNVFEDPAIQNWP